jgi:hypothetical protein
MKIVCKQCNNEPHLTKITVRDTEIVIEGYCETHGKLVLYVKEG